MADHTACAEAASETQSVSQTQLSAADFTDTSLKFRCKLMASLLRRAALSIHAIETTFEGEPLVILVADDGSTLPYIRDLTFTEGASVSKKYSISNLKGKDLLKSGADLVVVGVNRLLASHYQEPGLHIVPKWVRLLLPVHEEPYARICSKGRQARKYFKWMIKKVSDAGYDYEITTDPSRLEEFYHDMYKPYTMARFPDQTTVYKYDMVSREFADGALAFVKKDGRPLVGTVICKRGNTLHLPYTGATLAGMEAMKEGAAFALDYYLVQYAHNQGYHYVDFGHSRPFWSDGTLRYKMNWHMEVFPGSHSMGVFAIASPYSSMQAVKFLAANPFFELIGDKMHECRYYYNSVKAGSVKEGKLLQGVAAGKN